MVSPVSSAAVSQVATTAANTEISAQQFLTLLTAQLQHQDPLEPLTSKELLNQMAQLSTVAQMAELNSFLSKQLGHDVTDAAGLIGRRVQWMDPQTGDKYSGTATSARFENGQWQLRIEDCPECGGEATVPLNQIIAVQ